MRKITLLLFTTIFVSTNSFGQNTNKTSTITGNLVNQANDFGHLVKNKDTKKFVDKIYPGLISLVGGKDKLIEMTDNGYEQLAMQGISIDSVSFLKPNPIIETDNELQTTITEFLMMTIPNGRMITKSTLIAISQDKGITWYFLDTSGNSLKAMKQNFPNLSDKLIIEPFEKPIVYRD
jgi:hypothetical protein